MNGSSMSKATSLCTPAATRSPSLGSAANIRVRLCSPRYRKRPVMAFTIWTGSNAWSCAVSLATTSCSNRKELRMKINEELEQLLKNLKLRRVLDIYDEQMRAAEKEDTSYTEFVTRLMRAQWHARQEHALEWRIRNAKLPERWSLDTFPFTRQPGVNRKQIRTFAELDFVSKKENIVFVGPTGVGKTGLASGILLKALENGYRCQFVKAQDLFDDMYASLADRSTRQLLKRLARLDVLLVDELGYLNLKPEQSNMFFKLMDERYRRHSTIITTNLAYEEWPNFLGNRPMVEALLSRLRHYCHTVRIDGPPLREPQG